MPSRPNASRQTILLVGLLLLGSLLPLGAVPAWHGKHTFKLHDGTTIELIQYGDERGSFFEDPDGYTVLADSAGNYYYAQPDGQGDLVAGTMLPTPFKPSQKHLRPLPPPLPGTLQADGSTVIGASRPPSFRRPEDAQGLYGQERVVVILVRFTDVAPSAAHDVAYFTDLVFGTGVGKMNHYYQTISYGQLSLTGIVTNWLASTWTMAHYGTDRAGVCTDCRFSAIDELAREAVTLANPTVDFSLYDQDGNGIVDHIIVIHAGADQAASGTTTDIWSHSWDITPSQTVDGKSAIPYTMLSENSPMGTFAHEFLHDLGAPDLYDYDYPAVDPIGDWCLMSGGSWLGSPQGTMPCRVCGFLTWDVDGQASTTRNGWMSPTTISAPGVYTAQQISATSGTRTYTLSLPGTTDQLFFLENREPVDYDASLPQHGLLIYHDNENMPDGIGAYNDGTPDNTYYHFEVEDMGPIDGSHTQAAFSANDGQTQFTPSTTPNTSTNAGVATNIWITSVTSESSYVRFAYNYPSAPPVLIYVSNIISDPNPGNANGYADPGETVNLLVTERNTGTTTATSVTGTLSTTNPYITITDNAASWANIASATSIQSTAPHFAFQVAADCPIGTVVTFTLSMLCATAFATHIFTVTIGTPFTLPYYESFEGILPGISNELLYGPSVLWHVDTHRVVSGTRCYAYNDGAAGGYDYNNGVRNSGSLRLPPINLVGEAAAYLSYSYWLQTEPPATASMFWSQSFENATFPPTGWLVQNVSGAPTWARVTTSKKSGTASAYCVWGAVGTPQEDWLITSAIDLTGKYGVQLAFWDSVAWFADCDSTSYVALSTTSQTSGFTRIWDYACSDVNRAWSTPVVLDLSAYDNAPNVWIAWVYRGENAYGWYIDSLTLTTHTSGDSCYVDIKQMGAPTWTTLERYSGTSAGWVDHTPINLSAYLGQIVDIRFRFDTKDQYRNTFDGWYIDDVMIARLNTTPIGIQLVQADNTTDYTTWAIAGPVDPGTNWIMDATSVVKVKNVASGNVTVGLMARTTRWTLGNAVGAEDVIVLRGLFNGATVPTVGSYNANDLVGNTLTWATVSGGNGKYEGQSDGKQIPAGTAEPCYFLFQAPNPNNQGAQQHITVTISACPE